MAFEKLQTALTKAGISTGFAEPTEWVSTGNYLLNHMLTTDFTRGIPNKRTTMFWGPSGSGKSYLACISAKNAQDKGYFVVYIDTEDAMNEEYLRKIGMDLSEEKFLPVRISTLEEATKVMSSLFKELPVDQKVFFVMDSLTMLETEKENEAFTKGESSSDMGLFAKKAKMLIKNINNKIADRDAFFVVTNHAYQNQDIRNGEGVWIPSGGKGIIFIPSISLLFTHLKMKEAGEVRGIRIRAEVFKSRFNPAKGQKTELSVPYDRGIDPYDGLLEKLVESGLIEQKGAWFNYLDEEGNPQKFQGSKGFTKEIADLFLARFIQQENDDTSEECQED